MFFAANVKGFSVSFRVTKWKTILDFSLIDLFIRFRFYKADEKDGDETLLRKR